ncbi:MAG: rhomboid family intramembrane serine protease [Myxococcota bacterium]
MDEVKEGVQVSEDAKQVLRVRLRTPSRVPRFMYGVSILSAMTFVMAWGAGAIEFAGWLGLVGLASIGGLVPVLFFAAREPPLTPIVELGFDRLRLPRTADIAEQIQLTYREIDALFLRPGRNGFLWVGTPTLTFLYPLRSFSHPEDGVRLHAELQARIEARLPDGSARVEAFANESAPALRAYRQPIVGTALLLLVIVGSSIFTGFLATADIFNLVYSGALLPDLVLEHQQWWRLGASALVCLPSDGLIAATTVAVFGMMVERLFGTVHTITIALLATALGSAMSLLSSGTVNAGPTPIAMGIFAAVAFTAQSHGAQLPLGFRPPVLWWVATGGLLVLLTYRLASVDPSMLVGGALAGVIVTAFRLREDTKLPIAQSAPWPLWALTLAGTGALGACIYGAYANFQTPTSVQSGALLTAAQKHGWGSIIHWNHMGWRVATSESPSAEHLESAGIIVNRAVNQIESSGLIENEEIALAAYIDTLAAIRYRQHRFDEAIKLEKSALKASPQLTYATHLGQFMQGRLVVKGSTVADALPQMKLVHRAPKGFGLVVQGSVEAPTTVWALAQKGDELQGIIRFSLTSSTPVGETIWLRQKGTHPQWDPDTQLVPADVASGASEWSAWGIDPKVHEIPKVSR